MNPLASDLSLLRPELLLISTALLFLLYGVYTGHHRTRTVAWGAILSFVLTGILVMKTPAVTFSGFDGLVISNGFTTFMKCLILSSSIAVLIMTLPFLRDERTRCFEYPVLVLLAVVGMMLMVSANHFMALYMGLELQSLSLYVLAAIRRDSLTSTEAGLKYFVLGALASCILLFGISLIYGFTGTLNFDALAVQVQSMESIPPGLVVGLVFLLAGLCFKLSGAPFHMWTPDVYQGVPTPVTAFFAAAPKVAAMAVLLRLLNLPLASLIEQWQQVIYAVAVLSMIVGALAAIAQTNIKRLLAYSSIGHVGYILIGVTTANFEGLQAVMLYLLLYIVMTVGMFACLLSLGREGEPVENIADLAGLSRSHPSMAFLMAVLMLSMAGIPPMAGFFAKLSVILAAVEAGFYILAIVAVVTSVVATYYYLRIIKVMYLDDQETAPVLHATSGPAFIASMASFLVLFFFLTPAVFYKIAEHAASALFL